MTWRVLRHPACQAELDDLHRRDRREGLAVENVIAKLEAMGQALPHPHQSDVRQAVGLRELRPRQGRSPNRIFYRNYEDASVLAALGPEAEHDKRGFDRAVQTALERLDEIDT
jgi:hypothetical protein